MDRAEKARAGRDRESAVQQLEKLTTELAAETAGATGREAARVQALIEAIKTRMAALN